MENNSIIIYLACIVGIFILGKLFIIPLKKLLKVLINSILGGIIIYVINLIGAAFNFHIGLNLVNAVIVGILGIPGVVLLIVIQLF